MSFEYLRRLDWTLVLPRDPDKFAKMFSRCDWLGGGRAGDLLATQSSGKVLASSKRLEPAGPGREGEGGGH